MMKEEKACYILSLFNYVSPATNLSARLKGSAMRMRAVVRLPMNCISWNIGHLAWLEQRYWLTRLQGKMPLPHINELVGYGQSACTPPLAEMWEA